RGSLYTLYALPDRDTCVGRGRNDHRRAMRRPRQIAEHHAKAVVEGHGDADAIVLRVMQRLADEETVVEDVVVREGGALGKTGGARRVLDVDGVVELERRFDVAEFGPAR